MTTHTHPVNCSESGKLQGKYPGHSGLVVAQSSSAQTRAGQRCGYKAKEWPWGRASSGPPPADNLEALARPTAVFWLLKRSYVNRTFENQCPLVRVAKLGLCGSRGAAVSTSSFKTACCEKCN